MGATQRKDKLNRITSNFNTYIAALWSIAQQQQQQQSDNNMTFDANILKTYSWDIIQCKILQNKQQQQQNDKKDDEEEKYCYDPFILLLRAVICYEQTFCFEDAMGNDSEILLMEKSNVRMDVDENEEEKDDDDSNQTAAYLYRLLLAVYYMQMSQLIISFCCQYTDDITEDKQERIEQIIAAVLKDENQRQELIQFVTIRIIPFLRKSCILYNSFGCIESLESLWLSGIDFNDFDAFKNECDLLCDLLFIPNILLSILSISSNHNEYFLNYIGNISKNEIDYFEKKCNWDECKSFSLIKLPSSYNDLFQAAAASECKIKQIYPKYSAICLICGTYVCLDCCEFDINGQKKIGDASRHCLQCNNGFGVFLWLQRSKLILVWNNLCCLYQSVYLDKYGEEDDSLRRGNRISLNEERYEQLTNIITQHKITNKLVQLRKTNHELLERRFRI